jgi:sulfate adenylyltransferase
MKLIEPHGGQLKVAYLPSEKVARARQDALRHPSVDLNQRQLCDVKLLLNGAFSPLEGFLSQQDYERVLADMRLADGTLWPIPVTLDVGRELADSLRPGSHLALRDPEGFVVAAMSVDSVWQPDKQHEALAVFGTSDDSHPGVDQLINHTQPCYVGGALVGIARPIDYDFKQLRDDPKDLREKFTRWGWSRIVAFQTRNPMHRAHQELTRRAAQSAEANLLLHPVVGITKPGDVDHFSRVRCYEHVLKTYPEQTTALSLLPLAMRMAGPRFNHASLQCRIRLLLRGPRRNLPVKRLAVRRNNCPGRQRLAIVVNQTVEVA